MKTITYTEISFQELEQLIEQHLGVETSTVHNGKNFKFDCFSIPQDLEASNDTKVSFGSYDDITNYSLDEIQTYQYVLQLMTLGVIPKEHPILLDISW
jgi:hypothetical protein